MFFFGSSSYLFRGLRKENRRLFVSARTLILSNHVIMEPNKIDASKLVFNINVQNGNDTKGVKTAWENGLYFWGILESAGTYDFDFQLVKLI